MAGYIDQLRDAVPWMKDMDDLDVVRHAADATGTPVHEMADKLGYEMQGPFTRGLRQSYEDLKGTTKGAIGLGAGVLGLDRAKNYMLEGARENFGRSDALGTDTDSLSGIHDISSGVDYLKHGAGYAVGELAQMAIPGGIGAKAGEAVLGAGVRQAAREGVEGAVKQVSKAGVRGATAANAAQMYAQSAGDLYTKLDQAGDPDAASKAAGYALPEAALGVLPYHHAATALLGEGTERSLLGSIGKEAATQAAIQAPVGVANTALTRSAMGQPLTDSDAMHSYLEAGASGAVQGAVMGGITGPFTRRSAAQPAPLIDVDNRGHETDLLNRPTQGEQLGLFRDQELPDPNSFPRRPQPPNYIPPDLFSQEEFSAPPVEYTAATRAVQEAPPEKIAAATDSAPGLFQQVREAYLNSGAVTPEQLQLLNSTDPTLAKKRQGIAGSVTRAVTSAVAGAKSIDDVVDKLNPAIMQLAASGKQNDRARGESLLQVVYHLQGTPEPQRLSLDEYALTQQHVAEAQAPAAVQPPSPAAQPTQRTLVKQQAEAAPAPVMEPPIRPTEAPVEQPSPLQRSAPATPETASTTAAPEPVVQRRARKLKVVEGGKGVAATVEPGELKPRENVALEHEHEEEFHPTEVSEDELAGTESEADRTPRMSDDEFFGGENDKQGFSQFEPEKGDTKIADTTAKYENETPLTRLMKISAKNHEDEAAVNNHVVQLLEHLNAAKTPEARTKIAAKMAELERRARELAGKRKVEADEVGEEKPEPELNLEEDHAVQEPSAEGVDVRERPGDGEAVGSRDAEGPAAEEGRTEEPKQGAAKAAPGSQEELDRRLAEDRERRTKEHGEEAGVAIDSTPQKPEAKPPKELKAKREPAQKEAPASTSIVDAEKAWGKLTEAVPHMPKWEDLPLKLKREFADYGSDNWTMKDAVGLLEKKGKDVVQKSQRSAAEAPDKVGRVESIRKDLQDFTGGVRNDRKVQVVQSAQDIPRHIRDQVGDVSKTQGFVHNGKAWLIADHIPEGEHRAVFLHEVGSHLGLEGSLHEREYQVLHDKVREWAARDDGSVESKVAKAALERMKNAKTEDPRELVAYTVEEAVRAGIEPSLKGGELGKWMSRVWLMFKNALTKLGFTAKEFKAQDLVDLAHGAARMELARNGERETGTQRSFIGPRASGLPNDEYALARQVHARVMESNGATPEETWRETHWFKGPDGVWRMEVPDQLASMIKQPEAGKRYKLGDLMDHELLYKYYPEFADLPVDVRTNPTETGAHFVQGKNARISLSRGLVESHPDDVLSTLLHEVQHATQQKEGFAGGASTSEDHLFKPEVVSKLAEMVKTPEGAEQLRKYMPKSDAHLNPVVAVVGAKRYLPALLKKLHDIQPIHEEMQKWEVRKAARDPEAPAKLRELKKEWQKHVDGIAALMKGDQEVHNSLLKAAYYAHSGELEAYNVESRLRKGTNEPPKLATLQKEHQLVRTAGEGEYQRIQRSIAAPRDTPVGKAEEAANSALYKLHKGVLAATFTQDLADRASKLIPSVKKYMATLNARAADRLKLEQPVDDIYAAYGKLPIAERRAVDAHLYNSTRQGKWGYNLKQDGTDRTDPAMKREFEALTPAAQEVVKSVFKHGYDTLQLKKRQVLDQVASEYDPLIAKAKEAGDKEKLAKLEVGKRQMANRFDKILKLDPDKPYAPLTQFGNFVVVGRSQKLIDAERAGDADEIEKLKASADNYHVHFAETKGQAAALEAKLRGTGKFAQTAHFEKDDEAKYAVFGGKSTLDAINRLREMMNDQGGDVAKEAGALLRDMYLRSLAENSARKSELTRLGVEGVSKEMMRAFVKQGRADAHFISSVKHNADIVGHIADMLRETNDNPEKARPYYNELQRRYAQSLQYRATPMADFIHQATSVYFLGASPSYYLTNATQPFLMSLPMMAGKHGYFRSWRALVQAYKDMAPAFKGKGINGPLDMSKLPADVQGAMQELVNRGRITVGMEQELGSIIAAKDGYLSNAGNNAMRKMRGMMQRVEQLNRLSTAMAAYRLEGAKNGVDYADRVVYQTHGDYSAMNAPGVFNKPGAKLLLQFKKYQLIQATLLARMAKDAFAGATPEERSIGRAGLTYLIGHTAAVGGLMGLPMAPVIAGAVNWAFGDSEDPADSEVKLRRAIGDPDTARLLLSGVPAAMGLNVSGRVGMGQILNPFGIQSDISLRDRGAQAQTLVSLLGPWGSLGLKFLDGLHQMNTGNFYQGAADMVPKVVGDSMKAAQLETKGVVNKHGDTLMDPDDIGFGTAMMQALGLPPTALTERSFRSSEAYKINQDFSDRAGEIKDRYLKARKDGDADAAEAARQAWNDMQDARVKNGMPRQPLSALLKAPQLQRQRERSLQGGVEYGRAQRGLGMNLAGISE